MLRQAAGRAASSFLRTGLQASAMRDTTMTSLLQQTAAVESQLPSLSAWFLDSWGTTPAPFSSSVVKNAKVQDEDRSGADAPPGAQDAQATSSGEAPPEGEAQQSTEPYSGLTEAELREALEVRDTALASTTAQAGEMTERLKRTLADMENLRQRTSKQAENSQKFAIQGFLKSLLDVGDNLERAYGAVPPEALQGKDQDGGPLSPEKAVTMLNGIVNGLQLTNKIFDQALRENGVEKFSPEGQKFDPNLHDALFELPDPSKEPGTVGAVTKTGYLLNGRVVRPAQVGVVKAPS